MINAIFMLLWFVGQSIQAPPPAAQAPAAGANPVITGIAPLGFQLGAGDLLTCDAWTGNESLTANYTVAADGSILVGFSVNEIVHVAGLTSIQVRSLIEEKMRKIFRNPTVQCVQTKITSKQATLVGEATHPGAYPITGDTTLLDLLLGSGGYTGGANIAAVQVNRRLKTPEHPNGQQLQVNVLSALLGLDNQADLKLEPGDIVFVPSVQAVGTKIFIMFEGRSVTLLQSAEKVNLLEALSRAGSVGNGVSLARIVVIRVTPGKGPTVVTDVKFSDLYKKADLSVNIPLETGDIVFIPKSAVARVTDWINAVNPFLSFISNTALYSSVFSRNP
jgi:polysaccharide biosynthesis/export protein